MSARTVFSLNHPRSRSLAISGACTCSTSILAQSLGPAIADGHQLAVFTGSSASSDDSISRHVYRALNGGHIGAGLPASVNAIGADAAEARTETAGTLIFAAREIITLGGGCVGVSAVTSSGLGSGAAQLDTDTLLMRNARLDTHGDRSLGLLASGNAQVDSIGGCIRTGGHQPYALMAGDGVVTLRDAPLQTGGGSSDRLLMLNGGYIKGGNLEVRAAGEASAGPRKYIRSSLALKDTRICTEAQQGKAS